MRRRLERSPEFPRAMWRPRFIASKARWRTASRKEGAMPDKLPPDDLRSVWQSQTEESIGISLDEIRRKAESFQRRINRRNLREAAAAIIVVAVFGYYFWHFPAIYMRLASALTIAGTFYVMYHMFKKGFAQTVRPDLASTACLAFHRGELVRQRDLLRNIWWWYLGPL